MRQLATLPSADAAQTLADHLQTLRIETRLEKLADGWAVWVFDEDRLPQAREELAHFTQNPADPRFAAARRTAEAERQRTAQPAREPTVRAAAPAIAAPQPGLWTRSLILTSCLVFAGHTGWLLYQNSDLGVQAVLGVLFGRLNGLNVLTSPVQQALSIASFHVEAQGDQFLFRWHWLDEVEHGQVWRLITPIFLHFGVIHLLFNMLMLWPMGEAVEVRRGPWRYLALVVVLAVATNVSQYYLDSISWKDGRLAIEPGPAFGGMSGVLYGLFGYLWMKSRYEPALGLALNPRLVFWMLAWLFLCLFGVMGPVANTAHVSGLILGVVIGVTPHVGRRILGRRPT